jgi:hypothetical protein
MDSLLAIGSCPHFGLPSGAASRRKIVRAWRAKDWCPDHDSIAIFELAELGGDTRLDLTQIGLPPHRDEGHCRGWQQTCTPMKETLKQGSTSAATRANIHAARERIQTGKV